MWRRNAGPNSAPDDWKVSLSSESSDKDAPFIAIASRPWRTVNKNIQSEISGGRSQEEGFTERHVLDHEVVVNKIVNHTIRNGSYLISVRRYGYNYSGHTWEPTEHLPRSQIMTYFRRRKMRAPTPRKLLHNMPG